MSKTMTKNEVAWEKIFAEYGIIDAIAKDGYYEIESKTINKYRESRLMTKFDHSDNLPKQFKKHKLSILPLSRYKYIIGRFNNYCCVNHDAPVETKFVQFPYDVKSIDAANLYSESSALLCAQLTNIVDDILGEEAKLTIMGRMSTGSFSFSVDNKMINVPYSINVDSSQCEIDAGFESKSQLLIVEAKNMAVDDFIIRQLYYPYRLWQNKLTKKVRTALMTYSNNTFNFFEFAFADQLNYSSIYLVKHKRYAIGLEEIRIADLVQILDKIEIVPEPQIPFPQANRFERVVDLLGLLYNSELSKNEITHNYQFDARQTDYYANSAIYLGLVEKLLSKDQEIIYRLTPKARRIMKKHFREKYLALAECILEHEVFNRGLVIYLQQQALPGKAQIVEIMESSYIHNVGANASTIPRRASTVSGWLRWVMNLVNSH